MVSCIRKYQTPAIEALLRTGIGIVFCVATLLVYILIAAPCACCRCCRRCPIWCCWAERLLAHNMGKKTKIFILTMFLMYLGILAADVVYSLRYRIKINEGTGSLVCEAFKFGDELLNGYEEADGKFIGVANIKPAVENLAGIVADNSAELQSVVSIIDRTENINYAVDEFLSYLKHANNVLGDAANNQVGNYECVFCNVCCSGGEDSMTSQLISSISTTVASALLSARNEVKSTLTGDSLDSIRSALNSSIETIGQIEDQLDDTLNIALVSNRGLFDSVIKYIDIGTIVIVASMGVPTMILMIAVFFGIFRSHQKTSFFDPLNKPRNPCGMSFSWCITFLWAFLIFLIAGLVGIPAYLFASTCEIMADPELLFNMTLAKIGNGSSEISTLVNACIVPAGSGDLLSNIHTSPGGDTLRSSLNVSGMINEQFIKLDNLINSFESSQNSMFSKNPDFLSFLDTMDTFATLFTMKASSVSALTGGDPSLTPSIPLLTSVPNWNELLTNSLLGIPDCGGRSGVEIPQDGEIAQQIRSALNLDDSVYSFDFEGLNDFTAALAAAGIDIGASGSTCPSDLVSLSPPDPLMAAPFDTLVRWRMEVLQNTFRCDEVRVSPDPVTGKATGSVTPRSCTFTEWLSFVSSMRSALLAMAENVDSVQSDTLDSINTDLRSTVMGSVVPAVDVLLNGMNCEFLHDRYMGIYESLCWEETPGLVGSVITWLIFGCLCWMAIMVEFVLWRNLRDNLSLWTDNVKGKGGDASQEGTVIMALPPSAATVQASLGYNPTETHYH
jgi:hypothetical protein